MRKGIVIISFLLLCFACKKTGREKFVVNTFEKNPIELFQKIELILLETTKESLIGKIGEVKIIEDKIYVLDRGQMAIFIFSSKGKFLRKICNAGQGPGEYTRLYDFGVLKDGGLELLTATHLLQYNEKGEFVKEIKLPDVTHYFYRIDNEHIALYHLFADRRVSIFNTKTLAHSYYGVKNPSDASKIPVNPSKSPFFKLNGEVYLNSTFTNDIFKISLEGIDIAYTFFQKFPIDFTHLPQNKEIEFYVNYMREIDTPVVVTGFFNSRYKIASFFLRQIGTSLFLYDKETKKEHFVNSFYNVAYKGWSFVDNISYGLIEYDELVQYKKQPVQSKINCDVDSLCKTLTGYSNPTLVKYYLK